MQVTDEEGYENRIENLKNFYSKALRDIEAHLEFIDDAIKQNNLIEVGRCFNILSHYVGQYTRGDY